MKKSLLKLGTRKSLLAWSQSLWVAQQIEKLNPGTTVELVGMDTQGDKIQDKPLYQMEGKEFFTAELDHALLRGDTHLTVHSMKDLSLERPPQFAMAAIPPREFSHDVVIFHESVIERIKARQPIRIGTSSPRRLTLVPEFLIGALPRFGAGEPTLQFEQIRGNVNTRLSRVHEPEGSARKLDGVVLAFAGLERLSLNKEATAELDRLREQTRMMLIPVQTFPTAPAQGALAVECRSDQPEVLALIRKLHDPATERAIVEERKILAEWGGGCHQKLGASYIDGTLYISGRKPTGEFVLERRSDRPATTAITSIESAEVFRFKPTHSFADAQKITNAQHLFVAHARAFENLPSDGKSAMQALRPDQHVWVSGWRSWKKLAAEGIWVEGCLEGQGWSALTEFRKKYLLALQNAHFLFLSHTQSGDNPGAELLATYEHEFREIPSKVFSEVQLYWSSGLPFEAIWSKLNTDTYNDADRARFKAKQHFCGPGKTADRIRKLGFEPIVLRGDQ
jgi:hydroxymethylbilane synthase